jgi:hypothetical protein
LNSDDGEQCLEKQSSELHCFKNLKMQEDSFLFVSLVEDFILLGFIIVASEVKFQHITP